MRRLFRTDDPVAIDTVRLHQARVTVARNNRRWVEVDPPLVQRGRYFVDAASDAFFKRHVGAVWTRDSSNLIAAAVPLSYVVERDTISFYERLGVWSDHVAALERRSSSRTTRRERASLRRVV